MTLRLLSVSFISIARLLCSLGSGISHAGTPTETVLHSFNATKGGNPTTGVIRDPEGNFYGVTLNGGDKGYGVLYKLNATGQETVLHNFTGGADGVHPFGVVRDSGGNLYGTTRDGAAPELKLE